MTSPCRRIRTVRLTGKGRAALAATERLAPSDLFTPWQFNAIRDAGFDVVYVRLDTILEALS